MLPAFRRTYDCIAAEINHIHSWLLSQLKPTATFVDTGDCWVPVRDDSMFLVLVLLGGAVSQAGGLCLQLAAVDEVALQALLQALSGSLLQDLLEELHITRSSLLYTCRDESLSLSQAGIAPIELFCTVDMHSHAQTADRQGWRSAGRQGSGTCWRSDAEVRQTVMIARHHEGCDVTNCGGGGGTTQCVTLT